MRPAAPPPIALRPRHCPCPSGGLAREREGRDHLGASAPIWDGDGAALAKDLATPRTCGGCLGKKWIKCNIRPAGFPLPQPGKLMQ